MTRGGVPFSKLQIPVLPPKTLDRPRLRARLADALGKRLTLVAADAGFGKSTLLASHLAASGMPAVWYRLDPGDSDPARFAAFLLEGLRAHVPRRALAARRRSLNLVTDWLAAAQLLSAVLHRVRRDLLIVLDDFHLLASPTLPEGVTRWIEDLPAGIRLAILTRIRPDLPLGRWRAQGALAETGAEELRFTTPELRELLVGLHGLPLTEATVHLVAAKTEGWPAGIVLALHAAVTQGTAVAAQALTALSGSSREIYEYLAQEAFARQQPDVQRFLLATGLLSRFDAELADTVLGAVGSQQVIGHLERSHLFIVPLDRER
jgi:LuxR family maltose regulon positive regulatory protein